MTQQQVAEELGTVREVVSRGMRELVKEGRIEVRGGGRYGVLRLIQGAALVQIGRQMNALGVLEGVVRDLHVGYSPDLKAKVIESIERLLKKL